MKNTSKWKENLTIIISYAITIITSILIPELLISLFDLSIDVKILGLIFSVLILIIFILTRHIINKKQPNENSDEEKAKNILSSHQIENFKLYAISSAYWQDVLNSIENINIKNCTILIRKNDSLNSEIYENEVARTIEKWKVLRRLGLVESSSQEIFGIPFISTYPIRNNTRAAVSAVQKIIAPRIKPI